MRASGKGICFACLCTALTISSCADEERRAQSPASTTNAAGSREASSPSTEASHANIHDVLRRWSAGQKSEAVNTLTQLGDTHVPIARLRLYHMSEKEFVALPQEKRVPLGNEMFNRFETLRDIVREADRQAGDSMSKGDYSAAERIYEALGRLAAANSGPQMTLLANAVGRGIEKRAKAGFSALSAHQTMQPKGR